jgi:acyl carrier protein
MERESLFETMREVLADQLAVNPEQVTEHTDFMRDLEADSLDMLQLFTAFEDEFTTTIPDEMFESIHTVGDALDVITDCGTVTIENKEF